jgi:hypothetical protein
MKFFKDMLTEDDNQTFCLARFCTFVAVASFVIIGFIHVYRGGVFDFSQFGMGIGSVLGGGGVLIGGKAATQRDA